MQDLNDLYYFVKVVDHGGFAATERALGIPKSRLSRRLSELERRLGVRLIQRSTHRFVVSEIGRQYYDHCRAMLVEAETAQALIDTLQAQPRGVVKVTCPVGLLHFHVAAMLADFMVRYPQVTVHLEATNRRVDLLAEGVDIALRVRPLPLEDSELILRTLSDRGQYLVASPALVERCGMPGGPEGLARYPSLGRGTPVETHAWSLTGPDGGETTIVHAPRYVTTDMAALLTAALAGVGVVQLPALMLHEPLDNGALVRLLPDWAPRRETIHIVFPSRRGQLPSVRALIDFLVERYGMIDED